MTKLPEDTMKTQISLAITNWYFDGSWKFDFFFKGKYSQISVI